eukprot:gnl/TRDRNA2_/TRDRNA2_41214_c0_seq1.p1 gnl/TRDRNA2_/TRDRNA2_41214_c0~~gnl/TRDRNA2_/TRDRNA2_41214_c0_seq1.p1  ORF type:complete len:456 (-),score=84.35 gnl/TRDRNA2_/TRDRNA2_41214_c0_seq1:317-1684(-)
MVVCLPMTPFGSPEHVQVFFVTPGIMALPPFYCAGTNEIVHSELATGFGDSSSCWSRSEVGHGALSFAGADDDNEIACPLQHAGPEPEPVELQAKGMSSSAARRQRRKRAAAAKKAAKPDESSQDGTYHDAGTYYDARYSMPGVKGLPEAVLNAPPAHSSATYQLAGWSKEKYETLNDMLQLGGVFAHQATDQLRGWVKILSRDREGCWLVQTALDKAERADKEYLVAELQDKDYVLDAIKSPHGNHVISKVVQVMTKPQSAFVADALKGRFCEYAKHIYGCRVVQRLLEHPPAEPVISDFLEELLMEASALAMHKFGHHVMQTFLEHGSQWHCHRRRFIQGSLSGDIMSKATNQYASYVIEQALQVCERADTNRIVEELLLLSAESFKELARGPYGHFVVKAVLRQKNDHVKPVVPTEYARRMCDRVMLEKAILSSNKYGRRVLEEADKIYAEE